jgi:outer membrane protein OmpA-like peptidoglycan-associated protein
MHHKNSGGEVKKILMFSLLCVLSGCGSPSMMGAGALNAPATPIFFQPFSAALDESATTTIANVAKAAEAQPNATVVVTGAADSVGSSLANKYLSETRAQVVADALAADGVAPSRIQTRAAGIASAPGPIGAPAQSARRVLIQIAG